MMNLKEEFPLLNNKIFFASCSHGVLPKRTYNALLRYISSLYLNGPDWGLYMRLYEETRSAFSKLINASVDEIALIPTVSYGVNVIASSLHASPQRNKIIVSKLNFPTVVHVWLSHSRRLGFKTVLVSGKLEDYKREIDEKTLLVSLTHISYTTGFREYVTEVVNLAHEKGALVLLDDAQATGVIPLNVRKLDIDVVVTTCSKYLLGLPGLAFLYVKKEIIENLQPLITSWFAQKEPFKFDLKLEYSTSARRFEIGTPSIPSVIACLESLKFIHEISVKRIWNHVRTLSNILIEELKNLGLNVVTPLNEKRRGPLISIKFVNPNVAAKKLAEENIIVSPRKDVLRIALHMFNNREYISLLVSSLAKIKSLISG